MKACEVREFQKTEEEEKQRHLEQIDRERKEVLEEQQRALVEAEQLREEEERLRQNEPQNHIKAIKCEYCDSSVFIRWGENNTCPYCGAHLTF